MALKGAFSNVQIKNIKKTNKTIDAYLLTAHMVVVSHVHWLMSGHGIHASTVWAAPHGTRGPSISTHTWMHAGTEAGLKNIDVVCKYLTLPQI